MKNIKNTLIVMVLCVAGLYAQETNYDRLKPVVEYLKQSDLLSPDIKAGCRNHPEFFYKIAVEFVDLAHLVAIRPDKELVDAALEKVKNGKLDAVSFLLLHHCYFTYGEAAIWDGKFQEMYGESTREPYDWRRPSFFRQEEFQSSLEKIHKFIQEIGKQMGWEWEKINSEIGKFNTNAAAYLLNHFEECRVYASIFYQAIDKKIDSELNDLQAGIEKVKKEQKANALALQKKKEQNIALQRQCSEVSV